MESILNLWGPTGQQAREWLNRRGLPDQLIQAAGLGYNPQDIHMGPALWGLPQNGSDKPVWLPAGIVIPWLIDGLLWRINIRRFEGSPKYIGPKGTASRILLAFENDTAGDNAAAWWRKKLPRITSRLRPTQHDVNAMVTAGEDIEQWLRDGIASAEQVRG